MNLRTYLLATASSLAITGAAMAADMPLKAAPAAIPVTNWTGFYFGIHAGSARHNFAITENDEGSSVAGSKSGAVAGGQIGYNWQTRYWVWGLEADASWAGLKRTFGVGSGAIAGSTTISDVKWLASFRGRSGIAIDDTLVYVTSGLALGGVRNGWGVGYTPGLGAGNCCDLASSETRVGWVAGVGVEHMLSQRWTVRTEVLYYDLGRKDASGTAGGVPVRMSASNEVLTARFGLNLKW